MSSPLAFLTHSPSNMAGECDSPPLALSFSCRAMASASDSCGLTPLHYAAAANDAAACQLLMASGSSLMAQSTQPSLDIKLPCNAGMTPLHVAAMTNAHKAADAMLLAWVSALTRRLTCGVEGGMEKQRNRGGDNKKNLLSSAPSSPPTSPRLQ